MRSATITSFILILGVMGLVSCSDPGPKIGVLLELSGSGSDLGQDNQDGILLAADVLAQETGKRSDLVIRDITNDTARAQSVFKELYAAGIRLFLGPYTSRQLKALAPGINASDALIISTMASSVDFSDQKDHLFRVIPANDRLAGYMARCIIGMKTGKRTAIIYDTSNSAYSVPYRDTLQKLLEKDGNRVESVPFSTGDKPDFSSLLQQFVNFDPTAIAIICSGGDTGFIVQHIHKLGFKSQIWSSSWGMSPDVLRIGGADSDGLLFSVPIDLDSRDPNNQKYRAEFVARFGTAPSYGATLGYEAYTLLRSAISEYGDQPAVLMARLSDGFTVKGLSGSIKLDAAGDVIRDIWCYEARAGKFQRVESIAPGTGQ